MHDDSSLEHILLKVAHDCMMIQHDCGCGGEAEGHGYRIRAYIMLTERRRIRLGTYERRYSDLSSYIQ